MLTKWDSERQNLGCICVNIAVLRNIRVFNVHNVTSKSDLDILKVYREGNHKAAEKESVAIIKLVTLKCNVNVKPNTRLVSNM